MKRIAWFLLFILILGSWIWGMIQWREVHNKLAVLEENVADVAKAISGEPSPAAERETGYEITVDMWQMFEKELQDYKQRLREGKRQYDEQRSSWNKILTDLKKSLQEYDKFIAAEGEFWEKQLRGYEKLLAKNEERFELLGQVIEELNGVIIDFQKWWESQEIQLKPKAEEGEVSEEEEEEPPRVRRQRITPQIKGRRKYKTYPPPEEGEEEEVPLEETGEVIRGKITGSGEYETY